MAAPHQPIPETTQVHVDRLVGARLGDVEVGAKVCEGRFGTLYRARKGTTELTVEVLRAGVAGDDEEVRAANTIKCAGIADVSAFGHVPDGRGYRVMELLVLPRSSSSASGARRRRPTSRACSGRSPRCSRRRTRGRCRTAISGPRASSWCAAR